MIQKKINRKLLKKNLEKKNINLKKIKKNSKSLVLYLILQVAEKDKLIIQINQQNEKIYNIKNQISVYSSLGFKNTKKNILKNIEVNSKYQLAFYLALGDGIEASNDKEAPVIWNNLSVKKPAHCQNVFAAYKYVKGPKEIQLFLSQLE